MSNLTSRVIFKAVRTNYSFLILQMYLKELEMTVSTCFLSKLFTFSLSLKWSAISSILNMIYSVTSSTGSL